MGKRTAAMMRMERRVQGNESGRPAGDCRRKERDRLGDKKLVIGERRLRAVRFVWGRTGSLDGSRGEKEDKLKSDLELARRQGSDLDGTFKIVDFVNSNAMDRGKQIKTGLVDFVPHTPSRLDAYAYLEEPMEMTFGKFHFRVEKEGPYRLEIPISSGLSAIDSDFSSSTSSTESATRRLHRHASSALGKRKLAKIFSDMSFESSADSDISDDSNSFDSFNFIDRSTTVGKVFTNLYDGVTKPNKDLSSKYHQIYAIGETSRDQEETSEAFDDLENPYVDPSDLRREWMELQNTGPPDLSRTWTMNFDGSKRVEGAGAGVILVSPEGDKLKYVIRMTFPNASNNEAEYEALIHGMKMAKACGATRLKIFGDSQLVVQQVMNQCDAVNDSMVAYKEVYNELEKLFDGCEVNHISRLSNDEADVLANIGSQCLAIPPGVFGKR
ncbi:hypothetical protein QYE76_001020 [Lolium multiflorum]|uniref:RNase H type-1 domain-containing protein n=1 Tax=Lolium multiflorum TaxID=4521 RepID=A0AAD8RJW5_LOLMU|nr:hypothetical protein QYE76_001020 [Lolium multiflorum]